MSNPKYDVFLDRKTNSTTLETPKVSIPYNQDSPILNYAMKVASFSKDLNLTDIQRDVIDVATAVYYADRYCKRSFREEWSRDVNVNISIRDINAFKNIQHILEFALSVVSGDNIKFVVTKPIVGEHFSKIRYRFKKNAKPHIRPNFDCVSLLSGGQDSTAGAFKLIEENKTPVFVRINTMDKAKAKEIHGYLNTIKRNQSRLYNQQVPSLTDPRNDSFQTEESQRTRSFYFLAISAVIADSNDISDIYINENGIMAIHLPLDISRSSTFSTRTAYPLYISIFEDLMRAWLNNKNLKVINKWILKTKSEVVLEMNTPLSKLLISKLTRSCAHAARVRLTESNTQKSNFLTSGTGADDHCGYCFPCILRRISMFSAGIKDVDYLTNPFKLIYFSNYGKFDQVKEASSAVFSLISFCIFFEDSSTDEILKKYPQILECAAVLQVTPDVIIDQHKKFCAEVRNYIEQQEPTLLYLLDKTKSQAAESAIRELQRPEHLDLLIKQYDLKGYNEHFEHKILAAYSDIRFFLQSGIANQVTTKEKIIGNLSDSLKEVIPASLADRKETILNDKDGNHVRNGIKERCKQGKCYPL